MKLIKKLGTRLDKKGYWQSYGLYLCSFCLQEVEKRLGPGLRDKSCGCITRELQSIGNKGKKRTEKQKTKMKETHADFSGKNHPMYGVHRFGELAANWQGGKSFEIYPQEFKQIRKYILERDNYECQNPICDDNHKKLHVHHIDYDKKNNNPENLITLGISCHMKTNGKNKRNYWIEYYQNIIKNGSV